MKKTVVTFVFIFIASLLAADEYIKVDNEDIQEYSQRLGKWILIESRETVESYSKRFGAPMDDILTINKITLNRIGSVYRFIPYSDEYLIRLIERGRERTVVKSSASGFIWPINEVEKITSVTGYRNSKFHPGLDIPAESGRAIVASKEGVVIFSGYAGGYGRTVVLEHRNNFITRYSHNSANLVQKGEFVKKGRAIALVGSTGNSTGNHLHFEIRCMDIPLDPLDFLPAIEDLQIMHTLKNWK